MKEPEGQEQDEYTPGWYGSLQAAADAALADESVDFNQPKAIEFEGRKKNPLHEYKAHLRPAG